MKGMINDGIKKYQDKRRAKTYKMISAAARSLIEEGRKIDISNLVELTGLSNSTFSKNHVREFLRKTYGIGGKYSSALCCANNTLLREDSKKLLDRLDNLEERLIRADIAIRRTNDGKKKAERLLKEQTRDNEILRGQLDIAINQLQLLEWKKNKVTVNQNNVVEFLKFGSRQKKPKEK